MAKPAISFDDHELKALTRDIEKAARIMPAAAAKVVTKAAVNVKADARRRVSGLAHAPAYPSSIGFDPVQVTPIWVQTCVGPDKSKRQGALGNILEYGTVHNPPVPHLGPAAEAEEPRFAKAMDELAAKALER
jgi:hypothetical protein